MTPTTGIRRQQPRRVFKDRREAGQVLAGLLEAYRGRPDVVVLGLARGGIPVAYEVAKALGVPLDAFIVRKLGGARTRGIRGGRAGQRRTGGGQRRRAARSAGQPGAAAGDRRTGGAGTGAPGGGPTAATGPAGCHRQDRHPGRRRVATGSSMLAAVQALRESEPAEIVIAVPAARSRPAASSPASSRTWCAPDADTVPRRRRILLGFHPSQRRRGSRTAGDDHRGAPAPPTGQRAADLVAQAAIDAPGGVPPRAVLMDPSGTPGSC